MKRLTSDRILGTILIAAILILYSNVINFDFVNYDDGSYILINDHVLTGLKWDNIKWAFTEFYSANWHPLTWLSHMLDCSIYGQFSGGHHLTNVFFHVANSLLLFLFFKKVIGFEWRSFFIALLFAIHPLHVESVAWIAKRKDVLSTFFCFLSMIFYLRYVRHKAMRTYFFALLSFVLGLLSKPMIVTLPFLLILIDIWPLNRITINDLISSRSIKPILFEKILFLYWISRCDVHCTIKGWCHDVFWNAAFKGSDIQ